MSKDDKEKRLRQYLSEKVNPVFERLIIELLIETPENFIDFSVQWLEDKGRRLAKGEKIPRPQSSVKVTTEVQSDNQVEQQAPQHEDSEEEEDDDEEPMDEEEFNKLTKKKEGQKMRDSVSAEVHGKFNQKGSYVPKVVPKSEEQKQRIYQKLGQSFLFSALDEKEQGIVVGAMEEKKYAVEEEVIKQGDDGDCLYLVDSGELDCYRVFVKGEEEKHLKVYEAGEAFGELALLYNAPRAATIRAKTESVLFKLDRDCFNNVVKDSSIKKRERFEATLEKVELLNDMEKYERTQLCDGIQELRVKKGDIVIKQGDVGDKFYMVDEGQLAATKIINEGEEPQEVMSYKDGSYFGELALLKDIPRQATVTAQEDSVLVFLDKGAFKRLMGPIEDLLKRNEDKYSKFMAE